MAGVVGICNAALGRLGHDKPIKAMTEGSREAELCNTLYPDALDRALETAPWSFAKRRKALTEVASITLPPMWAYGYHVPDELVRGLWIEGAKKNLESRPDEDIPFTIEIHPTINQRILYTDEEDACLVYAFRQENTALFSGLFRSYLSWELAMDLRGPIAGKKIRHQDIAEALELAQQTALKFDFESEVEPQEPDAAAIAARQ